MEVHHHSHTERKKWTHYFWEFFMLFLAVFCGFLAENEREHYVEHKQEKQYMKLMLEDIKTDTAELQKCLTNVGNSLLNIDSALLFLTTKITDEKVGESYRFSSVALQRIPVVFTDRTLTQLKNSGRMRIVRSQKVMDALTNYWNHIEVIRIALDRHAHYRSMGRELEIRIFNLAKNYLNDHGFMSNPKERIVLSTHIPGLVTEYANSYAYCGVVLEQVRVQLMQQYSLATKLINLVEEEYHLK
ncbi:MAG TPA: hypothetical protein VJ765_13825 [Chitinophagaceae bacterium]|nr:hypothetical protein [Chitinophagaceae bacterium]